MRRRAPRGLRRFSEAIRREVSVLAGAKPAWLRQRGVTASATV